MDSQFNNKVVVIIAATTGLGTSTAIKFTQLGANLALIGLNLKHIQAVEKLCSLYSKKKPLTLISDIRKDADAANVIKTIIMHYNKIDVLINNARIIENGSIIDTDVYQYDRVFNTNVRSMYLITNLCVPYLIASKGNIVNMNVNVNVNVSCASNLAHSMAKAAIDQFTRCAALELIDKGVRVNCIQEKFSSDKCERFGGGRAENEIVAEVICFLASDRAHFITGACIPVEIK